MHNGDMYEGEWKDGEKWGRGSYYFLNKDIYEGYWKNGTRHGKVTIFN